MPFFVLAILFVAAVLSAPTEFFFGSGIRVSSKLDQGDGIYRAALNNETGVIEILFTPLAEFRAMMATGDLQDFPAATSNNLVKRKTTCTTWTCTNLKDLDEANKAMAIIASNQRRWRKWTYYWAHIGKETSFLCNWQANEITYNVIIDMHTVISGRCGGDHYGYDRRTNGGGVNDLSVGRTWRGGGFCF